MIVLRRSLLFPFSALCMILFESLPASAFFREPISVSYTQYNNQGESQWELAGGTKPITFESGLITQSFTYRNFQQFPKVFDGSKKLNPTSLSYSLFVSQKLDTEWNFFGGVSLSYRNARGEILDSSNQLFYTGLLLFNKRWGQLEESVWTVGLVILDQAARIPVVPALGFNYVSDDGIHRWILTFPQIGYLYKNSESLTTGVFINYENPSFNLEKSGSLVRTQGYRYLSLERAVAGFVVRQKIADSPYWFNFRIGSTFWGETAFLKQDDPRKNRDRVQNEQGLFLKTGLALSF